MTTHARPSQTVLIVIPCLNEAANIARLLDGLFPSVLRLGARIAVVDGGSNDGTQAIVEDYAVEHPQVMLLHNENRIQSAAVNLAIRELGGAFDYFIRIDAHGEYPATYCDDLLTEAIETSADSVVVSMVTKGAGAIQKAAAVAQNSRLGTGGAKHRHTGKGMWIDHGHHALMRVAAFTAVGGYDEAFRQNEDAELDFRLWQAGYRIWLTGRTYMIYFPRSSLVTLYSQYLGYGRGRARNLLKHRVKPKLRQLVPLAVFPNVAIAAFSFMYSLSALPLLLWLGVCAAFGLRAAVREKNIRLAVAGISIVVMHFAWSLGFWLQIVASAPWRRSTP
ncbi:MAG TPA: glycosyltransferase family 2 protein [Rhizobiaceae bacterium]|nr:glycosyltransferase family 2 protein [Rhizobiaceae bacterium]